MAVNAEINISAKARLQALVAEEQKVKQATKEMAREFGVSQAAIKRARREMDRQERQAKKTAKGTGKLSHAAKGLTSQLGSLVPGIGGVASGLGGLSASGGPLTLAVAGFAALTTGAVAAANKMSEFVDQQNRLSSSTGLSVHQVLALRSAIESAGGEFAGAESGLAEFVRRAQDAIQKGGEGAKVFAQYGIALEGMNGELRPAGDLLRDTLRAIDDIDDPTARAAARTQLFGAEAGKALSVLTGAQMDAAIARTRDLAAETEMSQKASAEMDKAMEKLGREWQSIVVILGREVTPAVVALTEALSTGAETARDWWGTAKLVAAPLQPGVNPMVATLVAQGDAAISAKAKMDTYLDSLQGAQDQGLLPAAPTGRTANLIPGVKIGEGASGRPQGRQGPSAEEKRLERVRKAANDFAKDFATADELARQNQMEQGEAMQAAIKAQEARKEQAHQRALDRIAERNRALQAERQLHQDIGTSALQAAGMLAGAAGDQRGQVFASIAQAVAYQAVAAARAAAEGGLVAGIPAALTMLATLAPAIAQAKQAAGQFDMGGQVAAGASQPDQGLVRVRGGETVLTPSETDRRRREPQSMQVVIDHQGYDAMRRRANRRDALYPRRRYAEAT